MLLKRNRKTRNTCHTDILHFRIPRDYICYSVHYYYHNFQAWGLPKKLVKEFSAEMETKYLWMSLLLDSILNQFSPFLHILFFTFTLIFSTHLHLGLPNGLFLCSFSTNMHFSFMVIILGVLREHTNQDPPHYNMPPVTDCLRSLRPKYLLQHTVTKHPQNDRPPKSHTNTHTRKC